MKIYEAFILGLVQGLGEFLPISSSGHLMLARAAMGIDGSFLLFDILLHVATLAAVIIVFFKDLVALFKPPFKTLGLLALASIPAVIMGLLFKKLGMEFMESTKYICFFFLFSAIIMLLTEFLAKRKRQNAQEKDLKYPQEIGLKNAVCMGLMQAVAVFPGITRSGSTIFGGIASNGERSKVARFSFFMSIPIIMGAALVEIISGGATTVVIPWYSYAVGMLTAFASGFLAIKFMLKLIAKANFKWFALYLFIISIISFIFLF